MADFSMTGSGQQVLLNPEWDYDLQDEKIENVHRTKSGAQFRYLWGSFKRVRFTVDQVSSATASTINEWWRANTPVVLYDASSAVVCSGYLVSKKLPIGKLVKPYDSQFMGTIELESY